MKGIVQGQESSAANPVLVLLVRSGQFLTDIVAGTYKIDAITGDTAVELVPETAINIAAVGIGGGQRLLEGQYVILTGPTASWGLGTHRAVLTYQLAAGGTTYTQVTEFEVISSSDWVSCQQFVSYASTRNLIREKIVKASTPIATLHRATNRVSVLLEQLCRRCFEPRFMTYELDGTGNQFLFLPDAIIALHDVELVDVFLNETQSTYDRTSYLVYNRHLSQPGAGGDDRYNPKIERVLWSVSRTMWSEGMPVKVGYYPWPEGRKNVRVVGVFGFTDPDPHADAGTTLGHTPEDLTAIVGALVARQLANPRFDDVLVHQPGRLRSAKTRDQAVSLSGGSTGLYGSATGDPLIDQMLVRFAAPITVRYTDEKRINTP